MHMSKLSPPHFRKRQPMAEEGDRRLAQGSQWCLGRGSAKVGGKSLPQSKLLSGPEQRIPSGIRCECPRYPSFCAAGALVAWPSGTRLRPASHGLDVPFSYSNVNPFTAQSYRFSAPSISISALPAAALASI